MSTTEISTEKRGRNTALVGLVLQVILFVGYLLIALKTNSGAVGAAFWLNLSGCFIWFGLLVIYYQRKRVAAERLESEALRAEQDNAGALGLFDNEEEYLVARRRLHWIIKWIMPVLVLMYFMVVVGLQMMIFGSQVLGLDVTTDSDWMQILWVKPAMFCLLGAAFGSFLFSRYVAGMAREPAWRALRAGSVLMFGNAVYTMAAIVCLAVGDVTPVAERIMAQIGVVLCVVLGVETLINFILDFYRPRAVGEHYRPAFESRLLALISEPGDIAKSIAEAVNYQFGFEVSTTWFYKTLQANIVRLAAVSVIVLVGMTSIVVVDANELGLKERWGAPVDPENPLGPGLYFKLPWPVEVVHKANVQLIEEMTIGEPRGEHGDDDHEVEDTVITWTEKHDFVASVDLIVATPELARMDQDETDQARDVAVSILRVSMPVQYRVKDGCLSDYLYNYVEPDRLLRNVAYRELVKQAVNFDYQKIMSEQRESVTKNLASAIQAKSDELGLGLHIVYVALQDIHPPTEDEVAATFQKVAIAEQQRTKLIESAEITYVETVIGASGDVKRGEKLNELIKRKNDLELTDSAERNVVEAEIMKYMHGDPDQGLLPIRGDAGEILARARADAITEISDAAAKAATFDLELSAYRASPELYKQRKLLSEVSGELDSIRKYVLVVDPELTDVVYEVVETEASGLEMIDNTNH
jgi:regulator of protease activity HflC (stomatin/prohibitin superfamily)